MQDSDLGPAAQGAVLGQSATLGGAPGPEVGNALALTPRFSSWHSDYVEHFLPL